jgi:hypothetical protein
MHTLSLPPSPTQHRYRWGQQWLSLSPPLNLDATTRQPLGICTSARLCPGPACKRHVVMVQPHVSSIHTFCLSLRRQKAEDEMHTTSIVSPGHRRWIRLVSFVARRLNWYGAHGMRWAIFTSRAVAGEITSCSWRSE